MVCIMISIFFRDILQFFFWWFSVFFDDRTPNDVITKSSKKTNILFVIALRRERFSANVLRRYCDDGFGTFPMPVRAMPI